MYYCFDFVKQKIKGNTAWAMKSFIFELHPQQSNHHQMINKEYRWFQQDPSNNENKYNNESKDEHYTVDDTKYDTDNCCLMFPVHVSGILSHLFTVEVANVELCDLILFLDSLQLDLELYHETWLLGLRWWGQFVVHTQTVKYHHLLHSNVCPLRIFITTFTSIA